MCCTWLTGNTGRKKIAILAPSHNFVGYIFGIKACIDNLKKNLLNSCTSSACPDNMVKFGILTAEICWRVWGTPANFNGFRILAVLLHSTLVVGVSQTLRRWTEGATYIWQGGHHVGHWPTFLVSVLFWRYVPVQGTGTFFKLQAKFVKISLRHGASVTCTSTFFVSKNGPTSFVVRLFCSECWLRLLTYLLFRRHGSRVRQWRGRQLSPDPRVLWDVCQPDHYFGSMICEQCWTCGNVPLSAAPCGRVQLLTVSHWVAAMDAGRTTWLVRDVGVKQPACSDSSRQIGDILLSLPYWQLVYENHSLKCYPVTF